MAETMERDETQDQVQTQQCLVCEEGIATLGYETQEFNYGPIADRVVLRAKVPVWTCAECDEQYLGEEAEVIKHEAVCAYLGRLTPREVKALRVSFGMRQDEFAGLTGYGLASIKRWEAGSQIQSESVDKHLRLLRSLGLAEVLRRTAAPREPEFRTKISAQVREKSRRFALRPAQRVPDALAA